MPATARKVPLEAPKGTSISQRIIADNVANEVIFGIVGHVGSGNTTVAETLKRTLEARLKGKDKFTATIIKARTVIEESMNKRGQPVVASEGGN
jgi:ABC-type glutathione transport system ATPase component